VRSPARAETHLRVQSLCTAGARLRRDEAAGTLTCGFVVGDGGLEPPTSAV